MAKVKKCFLCRAENLAKEFERNHQQGTLTMFKVTVDRAVEAVAKDANYFDVQPCKHAVAQWPGILDELCILQSQAASSQDVRVNVVRR